MATKIQMRHDTASNWQKANPVLMEGEMGIVMDDPQQYKIGDGVHSWNELPLRGFDGTLVHTIGNSQTFAISQQGVCNITGLSEYEIFSSSKQYYAGDIVNYNGLLYRFGQNHNGEWIGTDAIETSLKEIQSHELNRKSNSFFAASAKFIKKNFNGILDIWLESGELPSDTDLWLWFVAQPMDGLYDVYAQTVYIQSTASETDSTGDEISADKADTILQMYSSGNNQSNPPATRYDIQEVVTTNYLSNPDPGFRLGMLIDWAKVNNPVFETSRYAKLDKNAILASTKRRLSLKYASKKASSVNQIFVNANYDEKETECILDIKPNVDPRGMFSYGIGLWFIQNGDGKEKKATIYINRCSSTGNVTEGANHIVASYINETTDILHGITTVNANTLGLYGIGFLDFDITINWDLLPPKATTPILNLRFNERYFDKFYDETLDFRSGLSIIKQNSTYFPNNNKVPSFIINKAGEYGVGLHTGYQELSWTKGFSWEMSGQKIKNSLMSYSEDIPISGMSKIKVTGIPSANVCHVFLDSSKNFISGFGAVVGSSWGDENLYEYDVPSNAAYVSFSWYDVYSNVFATDLIVNNILADSTVNWLSKKLMWSLNNGLVTSETDFYITDLIDLEGAKAIEGSMVPGSNFGVAFFDSNKKLLSVLKGIYTSGSGWENNVGKWRVPLGAKYASFSWYEPYKSNFFVKKSSFIDLTLETDDYVLAVWNPNKKWNEKESYDNNGAFDFYTLHQAERKEMFDIMNNLPSIPPQLFLRSDKEVPIYKNSLFTKFDEISSVDVNVKSDDEAEHGRRIFQILEPTYFSMGDFDSSAQIFLQRTKDLTKLYYKDVKVFSKEVSSLNGKQVSVLSLGDSLTEGLEWKNTPVTMLASELTKLGVTTKFIGSLARNYINPIGSVQTKINYEGHGGWRYRTLVGLESQFAGLNVIIPSDPTKSEWMLGVDGSTMNEIKANNPFLYPATETDKQNNPGFCFHFVSGNTSYNLSYAENPNLGDYVIFDPVRYFSERSIEIPDIVTIAFGTNEWYLDVYGGFDLDKATSCAEFIFKQFRKVSSTMNIVVIPLNNLPTTRQEAWETAALPLCANVIRVVENMINGGDNHIFICPIYAQGSRWLAYNDFVGDASNVSETNSLKQRTMDNNVHMLYVDDDSNKDYADSLTACVINLIE